VPYPELNAHLNRYAAMVTTTLGAVVRFGRAGRAIERWRPGTVLRYTASPEPMLKFFEAAAAGCAVLTDPTEDFADLGFVDGESVVVCEDLDDMVEKSRWYADRVDSLRRIGAAAAELCRTRHRWSDRAADVERVVFG
jgi:glycosyltransferase involved in cell wall biosynthesis